MSLEETAAAYLEHCRDREHYRWEPSVEGLVAFARLSGDTPYRAASGRLVTPPKGGFYQKWRS